VKQSKKFLTFGKSSLSKILNASAFADFLSKNQFTPAHAQRRAGLPREGLTKTLTSGCMVFRHSFFLDEKRRKKSRLLKNSLKSTDYFTPQTRRAPWMLIFNNLFYAR